MTEVVIAVVTMADGYAEREAAKAMIANAKQVADEKAQITLGAYNLTRMRALEQIRLQTT